MAADPSRPFVTYYDVPSHDVPSPDGPPARVELSRASFDNWTAKTAGLLVDLGVEPGQLVSVVMPAHWQGLVWAQATRTVGARLALDPRPDAAVSVRGTDDLGSSPAADAGELVVVSDAPMGGPLGAGPPPGALDYGREVLAYPDVFAAPQAPPEDPLTAALVAAIRPDAPRRGLVVAARLTGQTVTAGLLVPLRLDGSVVLVRDRGGVDAAWLARVAEQERAERV